MSYDLCIWDPQQHAPMPLTLDEANAAVERLEQLRGNWGITLKSFVGELTRQFNDDPQMAAARAAGFNAFWGSDAAKSAASCQSAVCRFAIPENDNTRQIAYAVEAAAGLGLVVVDDGIGMCFLPDGTVLPEDCRAMWASDLAEMRAGPPDPALAKKGDGRPWWAVLASDLFDAVLGTSRRS